MFITATQALAQFGKLIPSITLSREQAKQKFRGGGIIPPEHTENILLKADMEQHTGNKLSMNWEMIQRALTD